MEERIPNGTIIKDIRSTIEYTIVSSICLEDDIGHYLYQFGDQKSKGFGLYRWEFDIVSAPPIIKQKGINTEIEINILKDHINSLKMDIKFLNDSIIKMVNTETMIIDALGKLATIAKEG